MKCIIRRNGLYLSMMGLDFIKGTWTSCRPLSHVFHSRREALDFLQRLPEGCEVIPQRETNKEN